MYIRVYVFKDIVYLGSVTLYYMDYFKPPPPPIFHSTICEKIKLGKIKMY